MLFNQQRIKEYIKQKIRYAICIALLLNCRNMRTYKAIYNITTTKEITNTKFLATWQRLRL